MVYGLEDKIRFGKYKEEEIGDIIDFDIAYMDYLVEEQIIELNNEVWEYYQNKK